MADEKQQAEGPRLVWTFPLVTRIQRGSRFLDLGSNISNVGSRVKDRVGQNSKGSSPDVSGHTDSTEVDELEREIDEVRDSSDDAFELDTGGLNLSQDNTDPDDGQFTVEIEDGVFVPTRVQVSPGDTVEWVNEDDEVHKISSIEGTEFTSEQLEPADSFEFTFEEEEVVIYVDTIAGGESMSGAVLVGDVESPDTLPSESEGNPVTFAEGDNSLSVRSMSKAAEDKDNMNTGFGE